MKRLLSIFLSLVLMLAQAAPAFAIGEGNIEGGSGDMSGATEHGSWSPGDEGVRVTVIRASDHAVVTESIDITNKKPASELYHFGKVSKLEYGGSVLSPAQGGYTYWNPVQALPSIVGTNGSNNIAAIKSYFTDKEVIHSIATLTGMHYDTLVGGPYKLLLEPLAYFKYEGVAIAATATECALYDQTVNGGLRYWMGTLTHQNLPFAMFLEIGDLGYPAWMGGTSGKQTNVDILSALGLGVVRFKEAEPEPPEVTTYDYTYRTGTEVITSVMVHGGQSDPDNPASVSFNIGGREYSVGNVYYPKGDSQLAWVRWTTPSTPQDMTIAVNVSGVGSAQVVVHCKIVSLEDNPPPNPVADDRNNSFSPVAVPNREARESAVWGVWRPEWYSNWVWHSRPLGGGYWCDHGWWNFNYESYSASLAASMIITPDSKMPTASGRTMKSGYGVNQEAVADVSSTQSSAVTPLQNGISYFSEFGYQSFWWLLERSGGYNASFQFRSNPYSTYKGRTHFTPIWYPDGSYTVNTWLLDCWTPAGMLCANLTDTITVRGSLWDDWHSAPIRR